MTDLDCKSTTRTAKPSTRRESSPTCRNCDAPITDENPLAQLPVYPIGLERTIALFAGAGVDYRSGAGCNDCCAVALCMLARHFLKRTQTDNREDVRGAAEEALETLASALGWEIEYVYEHGSIKKLQVAV